jgi:hypothetical protein
VTDRTPEEIYRALVLRIRALDVAVRPNRNQIRELIAPRVTNVAPLIWQTWPTKDPPELSAEDWTVAARVIAASVVREYWRGRPYRYRPKRYLPEVMIGGAPWETPLDMVHILDVNPSMLRKAMC